MATRHDRPYPPSSTNEAHPSEYVQEQLYHGTEYSVKPPTNYNIAAPPDYDTAVSTPEMEDSHERQGEVPIAEVWRGQQLFIVFGHPKNISQNQAAINELLTCNISDLDETNSAKIEASFAENPEGFGFSDASLRRGFIRKVYLILSVQLLITTGIISIFVFCKPAAAVLRTKGVLISIGVFTIILLLILLSCDGLRRKAPQNYILLGLFTISESSLLGFISSKYSTDIVVMAIGMTAVICIGLTVFAFQTSFDFTFCGSFIFISFLFLLVIGITAPVLHQYGEKNQTLHLVYASIGAIICSIYFIADTQIMMAGNHKYALSPEEYIFAALNLYIDMVYIFIYLLRILRYLEIFS